MTPVFADFLSRFLSMDPGHRSVMFNRHRYGMTVSVSPDGKRRKLYAEELGGTDHISFNLYLLDGRAPLLKPCEMPKEKVIEFVLSLEELVPASTR